MAAIKKFAWKVAERVGDFLDEAQFRAVLAWRVLRGKLPVEAERRSCDRGREVPILLEVSDWTDSRLLFSILVWPPGGPSLLESHRDQARRVEQVRHSFAKVCADRAWSTQWLTDYGLQWDPEREVWTASDGFSYEPPARLGGGASVG